MKILVVGAGAIGGYFGARLLQQKRDVTFLVRPKRQAMLADSGLVLKSPAGDAAIPAPPTVTADKLGGGYDLILLSCKAYDLDSAMGDIAPAVGPGTAILPMLNGMRHLALLEERFGAGSVIGGMCGIASTLGDAGEVIHLAPFAEMKFGERDGSISPRIEAFAADCTGCGFDFTPSPRIMQDMWEKWVLLASIAGSTSLMRAPLGAINAAPGGAEFLEGIMAECASVAASAGHPPSEAHLGRLRGMLQAKGSRATASMFRDILRGAPVEAEHVIGDLIARAPGPVPLLRTVFTHLMAYSAERAR
ncbi:2-dehydropantoate 2-reductase [Plastoroseomonas arctica]|uniref:2-dehydropantoate 2-reductase n=1 Tax=Plastoroseomonas arctica TaxID=1509237 RepID=A0AAF1KI80_9PROT|nr:2-dehydropantoate 2-reductase [Plastoroseomonas arctica]MBR0654779.1 2-dehydropantoate 2-reductase [Plastoroseomonas arctica]